MVLYLKQPSKGSRVLVRFVIFTLAATVALCACSEVGVVDPAVLEETAVIAENLNNAAYSADEPETAITFLGRVLDHVVILGLMEDLSDLDKDKCVRICEGLSDLMGNLKNCEDQEEMGPYIRQRCKSLKALALSIGRYDLEVYEELTPNETEDDSAPTD